MKKKLIIIIFVLVIISSTLLLMDNDDVSSTKEIDSSVDLDNGDEKINWYSLNSTKLDLDGKSVVIDKAGIYTLSGKIVNGNILVNTTGNVKLILDGVDISNDNGPAIIIEQANNTIIELALDSNNNLIDGDEYYDSNYDGCIYSSDDLIFQGMGTLNITSNYLDAIVSKDDLKIINGNYNIVSNDDGIRGKDSVYILDGKFKIKSLGDGIKSTNNTDSTKGYINILNGEFEIDSYKDGLQAQNKLIIYDGVFDIKTSDGSNSNDTTIGYSFDKGISYDSTSSKALKSVDNLVIKGGEYDIDSKDDAIHSNSYLGIENGIFNISSGDDGIHADTYIIIDDGDININKSYEGIESNDITINGGNIKIKSNDDGINISGGNDSSSVSGRPGENNFSLSNGTLTINNGIIYVDSFGDGMDANGNIIINNGNVYIDGPEDNGNGALDYDTSFDINGGTFIAVGSSGMAQSASESSKQYSLMFNLSSTNKEKIEIIDSDNSSIIDYNPSKTYSSILISTNKITKGNTYTLKIGNNDITSLVASQVVTIYGNNNGMHNRPNNPGNGNRPPDRR